jgi:hypothetical protein
MRFARAWPFGALLAMLTVSIAINVATSKPANFTGGDAPDYLASAYHLAHHHVYARDATASEVSPGIGREPGYPFFLAALMTLDSGLAAFRPECSIDAGRCDFDRFRVAPLANLVLVELSGVLLFFLAFRVTGSRGAAIVASGYTLLNLHMNRFWQDPVSDRLAMFLVIAMMLALSFAWGTRRAGRWGLFAVALAALTLTKAAFLPYSLLLGFGATMWALLRPADAESKLRILGIVTFVYAVLVGGWVLRNLAVSGEYRITDNRAGLVLSTREALDHMTPAQYAASFIYWTRGPGPGLARRLFAPEVIAPLGLDQTDGFYFDGQEGYKRRVDALAKEENIGVYAASAKIDREVIGAIFAHPLAYAATTLPVLYRGFWIDEFALIGVPALIFAAWGAWRRREILRLALLSVGIYNEVFHALITLNIPRYQITAMPSIAVAVAIIFAALLRGIAGRLSGIRPASLGPATAMAGSNAVAHAHASQAALSHSAAASRQSRQAR